MAIKTISLEVDAYEILCRARLHPRESFSRVVRRASWQAQQYTGATLLAFSRERSQFGSALSNESLESLCQRFGRPRTAKRSAEIQPMKADAFVVDATYMLELEIEVARRTEGPAMACLASNPYTVFRVSVVTAGEFQAGLQSSDTALAHQVLAQYEATNLSPVIAERYAAECIRLAGQSHQGELSLSNTLWVGCTAAQTNSPLVSSQPERYAGIDGLQIFTFCR